MPLPADLITEETIATLFDHLQGAAATARNLLANEQLSPASEKALWSIIDGFNYCQKGELQGNVPERER